MAASPTSRAQKYRADIDGLRAIAVLLVVFDHLNVNHLGGGYIGVDVFFVISGYLIGSSLIAEFRDGRFSLGAFYERRCRRILPALLVMVAICSLLAYRYLMPDALVAYQNSAIAALLSFSNFLFWRQSGYFDGPSASKPLLHTWSLAVEEQFYVFFPLLLLLIFRWVPTHLKAVLWLATGVSFGFAVWMVRSDPSTAFFWSPLRAWELLLGCMVSQYPLAVFGNRVIRETAAFAGFGLIALPAIIFDSRTAFPGLGALPPCLGAALIIAAGQVGSSSVGRLLSTAPFNFIGRISYSLYLWHWPFIVFQETNMMLSARPIWSRVVKLELVVISLVAATLSWRFVETSFRSGRFKPSRGVLFALTGSAVVLLVGVSVSLIRAEGAPARFPDEIRRVAAFAGHDSTQDWRRGICFLSEKNSFSDFNPGLCLDDTPPAKQYLIYGDSTAAALYAGLSQTFPDLHFQQATSAACPPTPEAPGLRPEYVPNCRALSRYMNGSYFPARHPEAILLAASWGASDLPGLDVEIKYLKQSHQRVILIGPEIEFDSSLPVILSVEMQRNDSEELRAQRISQHLNTEGEALDKKMKRLAEQEWHVSYISIFDNLCGNQAEIVAKSEWRTTQGCPLFTDSGDPLLLDAHHFTVSGSSLFAGTLRSRSQLR